MGLVEILEPGQLHLGVAASSGGAGQRADPIPVLAPDRVREPALVLAQAGPEAPEPHAEVVQGLLVFRIIEALARRDGLVQVGEGEQPRPLLWRGDRSTQTSFPDSRPFCLWLGGISELCIELPLFVQLFG